MDERYEKSWQAIEHTAARHVPFRVPKHMMGRGRCNPVKLVKPVQISPIKPSRRGELQPGFHGVSTKYALAFRQARRLQSYARYVRAHPTLLQSQHAFLTWNAIYNAKGFEPTFSRWWGVNPFLTSFAPSVLPVQPPDVVTATAIFDSMLLTVRDIEAPLRGTSRQYALLRRQQDPNLIFRDLKDQMKPGVDLLVTSQKAQIRELREEDQALVLSQPLTWKEDKPIYINGQVADVVMADHDCVWAPSLDGFAEGQTVAQQSFTGSTADLFDEFGKVWKERWDRHRHIPPSQWNGILAFADAVLPPNQFHWDPMTSSDFGQVVRIEEETNLR